jgi:hypothetical protein
LREQGSELLTRENCGVERTIVFASEWAQERICPKFGHFTEYKNVDIALRPFFMPRERSKNEGRVYARCLLQHVLEIRDKYAALPKECD